MGAQAEGRGVKIQSKYTAVLDKLDPEKQIKNSHLRKSLQISYIFHFANEDSATRQGSELAQVPTAEHDPEVQGKAIMTPGPDQPRGEK